LNLGIIKLQEKKNSTLSERWNQSRSGAWANRGFHFQHLFTLLILVRQWAGLSPTGNVIPEGLEDCVIEMSDYDLWFQIKSKKTGCFTKAKVDDILSEVKAKANRVKKDKPIYIAVGLEKKCTGRDTKGIDDLFKRETDCIIHCNTPEKEATKILNEELNIADILIEGLVSDLYKYIADVAVENTSLPYESRKKIPTTGVERRILARLEAEDSSAIDLAFTDRTLEPVDLCTCVYDPAFYQGIKAKAGHVASGQILRRNIDMENISDHLYHSRQVLISGPSGAGKSSLLWLVANSMSANSRWFQINSQADVSNADSIIRFIKARNPHQSSSISLAFDEVGTSNHYLWDKLVHELRGIDYVYLLGSIRQEDVYLISNQSDTKIIEISLNERIANDIWLQLKAKRQTDWLHWREPFEISDGLMLEYIHILTKGERLSALITEQVSQREKEQRNDELAIIRATSVLCACGGEIDAKKLFIALEIPLSEASHALKRLLDEHLVSETRAGILGGLHLLRSTALVEASHDEIVYQVDESLWSCIKSVTTESLPHVIRSIYIKSTGKEQCFLEQLAEILLADNDIELWVAILTGLGFVTLEKEAKMLISVLRKNEIRPSLWSVASLFAVSNTEIPDLPKTRWSDTRSAILEYRELPTYDFRAECLNLLGDKTAFPIPVTLKQATNLFSCFAPIANGNPVKLKLSLDFSAVDETDIHEVVDLIATANTINPKHAEHIVSTFGGEKILLTWMQKQIPWLAEPVIETMGDHGRTVRANWFYIDEVSENDSNKTTVDICEMLIALSPASDAAASDAVNSLGRVISVGEFQPYSKNMSRDNISVKSQIAWNITFRQIIFSHMGENSLTNYVQQISVLLKKTEKIFRLYTEKWMRRVKIKNADALTDEINELIQKINNLSYMDSSLPTSIRSKVTSGAGMDDPIVGILSGILSQLLSSIASSSSDENKLIAIQAADYSSRLSKQLTSSIWRTIQKPPKQEITLLAQRLNDIASIFHEMAYNQLLAFDVVKYAKKGNIGKAVYSAAYFCTNKANIRLKNMLKKVETILEQSGWTAKCWLRTDDKEDSPNWPSKEIAILVDINSFEDGDYSETCLHIASDTFKDKWRFYVVPVINNQVIASLAMSPPNSIIPLPFPYINFYTKWKKDIKRTFHTPKVSACFDIASTACHKISSIILCRDMQNLHPKEDDLLEEQINLFKQNLNEIEAIYEDIQAEIFQIAIDYLNGLWERVVEEFELKNNEEIIDSSLCLNGCSLLSGKINEDANNLGIIRMLIMQEECYLG
jgi:energy-coupling factor transporter ATP-binding protein EcfA2